MPRIVNHYQSSIKLPITQLNGSPYSYTGIQFSENAVRLSGYAGGPYAAFSVNIDIYEDLDDRMKIYDTKHHLDYSDHFNKHLILDFVDYFRHNINVREYNNQPTNSGLVMLSSEDTDKLRQWASSHKFAESVNSRIIFDKVLNEKWEHWSGHEPRDGMTGGSWEYYHNCGEYEKEVEVELDGTYYLVYLTMDAELSQGYDDSVGDLYHYDVDVDEDSIQLKDMMRELSDEQDVTDPELRNKLFELAKEKLLDDPDRYFENDFYEEPEPPDPPDYDD